MITLPSWSATFKAMMDALVRLYEEGADCCGFQESIINLSIEGGDEGQSEAEPAPPDNLAGILNESQAEAVQSCVADLSLIWGPPGVFIFSEETTKISDESQHRNWENNCSRPDYTTTSTRIPGRNQSAHDSVHS